MRAFLCRVAVRRLPAGFDVDRHFNPAYQRMCLVPEDDFFRAVRCGRADVVTDHVDSFIRPVCGCARGGTSRRTSSSPRRG